MSVHSDRDVTNLVRRSLQEAVFNELGANRFQSELRQKRTLQANLVVFLTT